MTIIFRTQHRLVRTYVCIYYQEEQAVCDLVNDDKQQNKYIKVLRTLNQSTDCVTCSLLNSWPAG